jgi:hypothetical protein
VGAAALIVKTSLSTGAKNVPAMLKINDRKGVAVKKFLAGRWKGLAGLIAADFH